MIRFTQTTIQYIEEMAFAGISTLRILHLVRTGLLTMPPLDPVRSTLKELYLDFNNISFVPRGYFSGFKTFHILSIRYNILRLFSDITQLQLTISKLLLRNNILQSIPDGFNGTIFPKLTSISLENNRIRAFPMDMLASLPGLRGLSLSNNRIVQLPAIYQKNSDRNCSDGKMAICSLSIVGNPIHCGGETVKDIINWRSDNGNSVYLNCYVVILDLWYTKCASPASLRCKNLGILGMWA